MDCKIFAIIVVIYVAKTKCLVHWQPLQRPTHDKTNYHKMLNPAPKWPVTKIVTTGLFSVDISFYNGSFECEKLIDIWNTAWFFIEF